MIVRPVFPSAGEPIDTAAPGARARLAEHYPPPAVRINLVQSANGVTRDASGTSTGLTLGADRAILGAIRSVSDAVLIGAATLRAEPGLVPATTPLVVLTRTGDFAGLGLPALPPGRLLVVGPAAAESRARASLRASFEFIPAAADLAETMRVLGERFPRIVCEGGPGLGRQLLAAGLADELCLTTSPLLIGGPARSDAAAPVPPELVALELLALLVDEAGSVYQRWVLAGT